MMADLRQACDRCHSKKLRCTKTPDTLVCVRCLKAGVPCIFSPPTRSLRNGAGAHDSYGSNLSFDWSAIMSLDHVPQNDALDTTPPVSDSTDQGSLVLETNEITQLT